MANFAMYPAVSPVPAGVVLRGAGGNLVERVRDKGGQVYSVAPGENLVEAVAEAHARQVPVLLLPGVHEFAALVIPVGLHMYGCGKERTTLRYTGAATALQFPGGDGRCLLQGFSLVGAAGGLNPGVGISYNGSHFNLVRGVAIWRFTSPVQYNTTAVFSAYNGLEDFEINECGPRGLHAGPGTNASWAKRGRVFWAPGAVGVELDGVEGFDLANVAVESAGTCVRVVNCREATVRACYLEPGGGGSLYELSGNKKLTWTGNTTSGIAGAKVALDLDGKGTFDGLVWDAQEVGWTGGAAADRNYLPDGDLSRRGLGWTAQGGLVVTRSAEHLTGDGSEILTPGSAFSHWARAARVPVGVTRCVVQLWLKRLSGVGTLVVNVVNAGVTYQASTAADPAGWVLLPVAVTITDPADRDLSISIYPDAETGTAAAQVDAVQIVRGSYVVPYRPYREGGELLAVPVELYAAQVTGANEVPGVRSPAPVPATAVGMRLRVVVEATHADDYPSGVYVGTREFHALRNGRPMEYEATIRGTAPTVAAFLTNGVNTVTYSIHVLEWIHGS